MPLLPMKVGYGVVAMSLVRVKVPYTPLSRAWTTRSGIRSRLKCISFANILKLSNVSGPRQPAEILVSSSATGAPLLVVNGHCSFLIHAFLAVISRRTCYAPMSFLKVKPKATPKIICNINVRIGAITPILIPNNPAPAMGMVPTIINSQAARPMAIPLPI
jgi:hypothetical protein